MRQHFTGGLAVADEVVVDEVQARGGGLLRKNEIQLLDQLLRRLEPRLPAVQIGNIAKLALVRASRGELQGAQQVLIEFQQVVCRFGKIAQTESMGAGVAHLLRRGSHRGIQTGYQIIGGLAEFS